MKVGSLYAGVGGICLGLRNAGFDIEWANEFDALYSHCGGSPEALVQIVKDDISYLPLHHQVISWASAKNVNVPIRPNNEPLFRFSSKN